MVPTDDQIDLMDQVFDFLINHHINRSQPQNPTSRTPSKFLSVKEDLAQFIKNQVCEIGHDLGILTAQKLGYGDFEVVNMDKYKSENFKNNGGFKSYFAHKGRADRVPKVQNIITTHNYGNNTLTNIAAGVNVEQKEISANFSVEDYTFLEEMGVDKEQITELKEIVQQESKDKKTFSEKVQKWLGAVSISFAAKGLADKLPAIINYVHGLIDKLPFLPS